MDTLEAVKEQLTEHSDELGIVNIDIRKYNSKEKVIVEVMNKSAEVIVKAEDIVGRDLDVYKRQPLQCPLQPPEAMRPPLLR